ncbi:MAG: acetyl-CoA carboxylase biotin carboxylase subunit [Balneolaceae bacterium]
MGLIKKVLIANRGEIALRIIRTCKEKGIRTVAVYSEPDAKSPHVLAADESVCIGPAKSSSSYLNMDRLIEAVKITQSDAIHPGYGFLSENAEFAKLCGKNGIIFIGPSPESIEMMGDKTRARKLISEANVPYPPGSQSELESIPEGKQIANDIGYPVLIKAAAGGGGKGMRIIYHEKDFESGVKAAKSEAKNAFGDDRVFVEKYLEQPRHIEFQIFADQYGNTIHLFERECSIQRRHQKVIEEAPSPLMDESLRAQMSKAAISVAKSCQYVGAGTVEFLVDKHKNFYFLEMNTRLQVEHPVTELITGLDLVSLQIDVANGKKLPLSQKDVSIDGHAIECRIYAEDPENNFLPSTGKLSRHRIPSGPGIRVDAGIEEDQVVSIHYDPMLSKLCSHSHDRKSSIQKMLRALDEYEVSGVKTTIPFCKYTLNHQSFKKGVYDTHFVKDHFNPKVNTSNKTDFDAIMIVSSMLKMKMKSKSASIVQSNHLVPDGWWKQRRK